MAAADYYNTASRPQVQSQHFHSSPYLAASQPPPTFIGQGFSSSHQNDQAPPPYQPVQQEQKPGVHFAPAPTELHHQTPSTVEQHHYPSFSSQQRPSPQNWNSLQPADYQPSHQHAQYHPSSQRPPQPYPGSYQSSQPAFAPPHMRPYVPPNHSEYSLENGYSSDPESRRRSRKHRTNSESKEVRRGKSGSRSTTTDGFLGAAGGGLIGDLIFPGLGTLGGAALGWIGGKDYGSHRKRREDQRHRDQRDWEKEHGHRDGSPRHGQDDGGQHRGRHSQQ